MKFAQKVSDRIKREWVQSLNYRRIYSLAESVKKSALANPAARPVLVFNASTRLQGLSLNAAFSLLTSLGVQLAGTPVIHYVCKGGLSHCVLGTDNQDVRVSPPCRLCIQNSRKIFASQDNRWFEYSKNPELESNLQNLTLTQLIDYQYEGCPYGELVLPSLRWILRCHHLQDDEPTRWLAREYILSAASLLGDFRAFLEKVEPQAVVVFNGMFYPEAVVRWLSNQNGIPVVSHEVGMQPFSAFFTHGDATAYPLQLPRGFSLTPGMNAQLDDYLSRRFLGDFVTAGIKFWPEMHELGQGFWQKIKPFKQFVPIFTNVVFDTSQAHANVLFPDMFAWLDEILRTIPAHPETLFIIRAHPDELRPGKESRESVAQWVRQNKVDSMKNVIFINSNEMISSYELIEHAKFVMVYNSTVGLEAAIKGKPVLCAGKARYTQMETVFFPESIRKFQDLFSKFLSVEEISVPPVFIENARKMLYGHLFLASLPFDEWIESDGVWNGFVSVKDFPLERLHPQHSSTVKILVDGILHQQDFLLKP